MILMDPELQKTIPRSQKRPKDPVAYVKYFVPWGSWTWYGIEYDPKDRIMFGLVYGFEAELGSWSLEELEGIRGPGGLTIERDLHFTPKPLSECNDPTGRLENPMRP